MPKNPAFEVLEAVSVDVTDPQTGRRLTVAFEKGSVSPKNEGEEAALEGAVASGHAKRPVTKPEPAQEAKN